MVRKAVLLTSLIFILFILSSCGSSVHTNNGDEKKEDLFHSYTTKTGKIITVTQESGIGSSLITILVLPENFENNIPHILKDIDPIISIVIEDLDNDGFEEIYLVSNSAGSGSYGYIYAFASNRDKSLTPVYFPLVSKNDMNPGGTFEGYMGHDVFSFEDGKIIRTFPLYLKTDTNSNPTGAKKKITYSLLKGEAAWKLEITGSELIK